VGASEVTDQQRTIRLNGDPFALPQPLAVADLLRELDIDARRVAVEVNGLVVKRARYDTTVVSPGDEVEVVHFVGGG
jgi:sulfur carrier protein